MLGIGKRLRMAVSKRLSKWLGVLALAVLLAGVLTLVAGALGITELVSAIRIDAIPYVFGPRAVVFVAAFVLALIVALVVVSSRRNPDGWTERWLVLPVPLRAVVLATPSAALAGVVVGLTARYSDRVPVALAAVSVLVVWPIAAGSAWRAVRREASRIWLRGVTVGTAGALLVGGCVVVADAVLFGVPNETAAVTFLALWPLSVSALGGSEQSEPASGPLSTVLIETGYTQRQRVETRTVAVVGGFVGSVLLGTLVWSASDVLWVGTLVYVLAWPVLTVAAFALLAKRRRASERAALTVVAATDREGSQSRELTVENESQETVDLGGAKLRDAGYDRYRLGVDVTLGTGERCTFDVPPGFSLDTDDTALSLPLGYTLRPGQTTAVVYARDGTAFPLRIDGVTGNS